MSKSLAIVRTSARWTPFRSGTAYCSPACGSNCQYLDYVNAKLQANRTARNLGEGWSPRIWENGGWHWSIRKGACDLHKHGTGSFWANLIVNDRQYHTTKSTAKKALDDVISMARRHGKALLAEAKYLSG